MSPYAGIVAQEASTTSASPNNAADFVGQWMDSLGNDVYVELVDGAPKVSLRKFTGGRPHDLWLYFDHRLKGWRCGNGLLTETVFGASESAKAKVLQFAAWTTKDGRVSTWTRALPTSEKGSYTPTGSTADEEPSPSPVSKDALRTSQASSNESETESLSKETSVKDGLELPKKSRFARSWYEVTEEWDKDKNSEFAGGCDKLPESRPAAGETQRVKKTRRGRRRAGRGTQH